MQQKYNAASTGAGSRTAVIGLDGDRDRAGRYRGPQSRHQTFVGQQPRVDPAGQRRERLDRHPRRIGLLSEHARDAFRRPSGDGLREPQVDRQCHQVLLRTVVDVALQAAPLGVLRFDEPFPRRLELVGSRHQLLVTVLELGPQPDQPQHQPGLGGQPGEQPLLHCGERRARSLLQAEHPQQLTAVPHGQGSPAIGRGVHSAGLHRRRGLAIVGIHGPRGRQRQAVRNGQPYLRPLRPGSLSQQHRHPGRQLLNRVAARESLRKTTQHVVRRGRAAVPHPGRDPFQGGLHGREQERHGCGRHNRQEQTG